jgi:hypothetical protein
VLRAVALFYAWTVGLGIAITVVTMLVRDIRDAIRGWHRRSRHPFAPSRRARIPTHQRPALARLEMRVIERAEDQDQL